MKPIFIPIGLFSILYLSLYIFVVYQTLRKLNRDRRFYLEFLAFWMTSPIICIVSYLFMDYFSNRTIRILTDKNGTVEVVRAMFYEENRTVLVTDQDELSMITKMFRNAKHSDDNTKENFDYSIATGFFGEIELSNLSSIKLQFYLDKSKESNKVYISYGIYDDFFRGYLLTAPPEIMQKLEEAFRSGNFR